MATWQQQVRTREKSEAVRACTLDVAGAPWSMERCDTELGYWGFTAVVLRTPPRTGYSPVNSARLVPIPHLPFPEFSACG